MLCGLQEIDVVDCEQNSINNSNCIKYENKKKQIELRARF